MKIEVEACHDRVGIQINTPNDVTVLSLEEGNMLVCELAKQLNFVRERKTPPAPLPLLEKDIGHETEKEFCSVGSPKVNEPFEPYFDIGGFELGLEDVRKIRTWLEVAIRYVES